MTAVWAGVVPAPAPVVLRRTSPRMAVEPAAGGWVRGVCEHCGWVTEAVPNAGIVSSLAAEHGRVLSDTSAYPACTSVLEVEA